MDINFSQPSTPTVTPVLDHNKMFDLAEQLITLRDDKDKLEDRLKKLNTFIEETEFKLSDAMALSETQNFTRSGKTFYLTTKTRASAASNNKDALFNALKTEGFDALVYETVNANSLSSFVKEQARSLQVAIDDSFITHPEGEYVLTILYKNQVSHAQALIPHYYQDINRIISKKAILSKAYYVFGHGVIGQ